MKLYGCIILLNRKSKTLRQFPRNFETEPNNNETVLLRTKQHTNQTSKLHFPETASSYQPVVPIPNKRTLFNEIKKLKAIPNPVKPIPPLCYLTIPSSLYRYMQWGRGGMYLRTITHKIGILEFTN
jgi:hypothetical protein